MRKNEIGKENNRNILSLIEFAIIPFQNEDGKINENQNEGSEGEKV